MAKVILKDIKKIYPNTEKKKKVKKGEEPEKKNHLQITDEGVVAVQQFSLEIADREFIVLVGPSGCGKSTTLRMIAGLEDITSGELWIGDKLMNDVEPKDRDIAMVFQNYALYPHMTVYENMAFSLKLKKLPKDEIDRKVREAAEILDITQYLDRKPKALSGGQRQRVAPSSATPPCSLWTSLCPIWTPSCVTRCAPRSSSCASASTPRLSTSPTTRRRR